MQRIPRTWLIAGTIAGGIWLVATIFILLSVSRGVAQAAPRPQPTPRGNGLTLIKEIGGVRTTPTPTALAELPTRRPTLQSLFDRDSAGAEAIESAAAAPASGPGANPAGSSNRSTAGGGATAPGGRPLAPPPTPVPTATSELRGFLATPAELSAIAPPASDTRPTATAAPARQTLAVSAPPAPTATVPSRPTQRPTPRVGAEPLLFAPTPVMPPTFTAIVLRTSTPAPATATSVPTFTAFPTYTPPPTYTAQATYTALPTFTAVPTATRAQGAAQPTGQAQPSPTPR